MPDEKEARQSWKTGRASVNEDDGSIPQSEIERGYKALPLAFALLVALYAVWEMLA